MFKDGGGGLNVNHPDFCGPRSKSFDLDLLLNCDRDVLVPRYFPIRFSDLVKQYASYWHELVPENRLQQGPQFVGRGKHCDLGNDVEQVSNGEHFSTALQF